jgi:hypothetical protein
VAQAGMPKMTYMRLSNHYPGYIGTERKGKTMAAGPVFTIAPNPFKATVNINYELQIMNYELKGVHLAIYDINGRCIKNFTDKIHNSSFIICNSHTWNASGLPSGVYVAVLKAGNRRATRRMVLQK